MGHFSKHRANFAAFTLRSIKQVPTTPPVYKKRPSHPSYFHSSNTLFFSPLLTLVLNPTFVLQAHSLYKPSIFKNEIHSCCIFPPLRRSRRRWWPSLELHACTRTTLQRGPSPSTRLERCS